MLSLSSELSIGVPDAGLKARSPEQLQQFVSIPPSFLAQLAGLIDGDGYIFASAVGGMQNSYFFMGLRSLKKIGALLLKQPKGILKFL